MTAETPIIINNAYTNTTGWAGDMVQYGDPTTYQRAMESFQFKGLESITKPQPITQTSMPEKSTRRIVQVFIADPNENVPLDQSVIYTGEQKLTDLNDTELFFEVPIKELLDKHNAQRVKFTDKEASKRAGKDILLDPVKIRDLKMVVVTVAQF